jgi:FKBP-type peptidyl-prolyl cis-trans isomerase
MKRRLFAIAAFVFTAFVATSCLDTESDYEKQVKIDDQILAEYVEAHQIDAVRHNTGLYYQVIDESGSDIEVERGDVVSLNYTISLLDGTTIETNAGEHGEPVRMKVLAGSVIPEGLDYGVNLMNMGDKYRFIIPSYLAYGSYSTEDFPSHSNFILDVEVVDIETETEIDDVQRDSIANYVEQRYEDYQEYASGLYFIDSIPGDGERPFGYSAVIVDFERKYLDGTTVYENEGAIIHLDQNQAVEGLEEGIKLTKEGGTSVMIMPASIGFKQSVCVIPERARDDLFQDRIINNNVKPYSILKYIVELKAINI